VPRRTYNAQAKRDDGSTYTLKAEVGDLTPASKTLPAEFSGMTTQCGVDPQRDLFVPIRLRATSTNAGNFDQTIPTGYTMRGFSGDLTADIASDETCAAAPSYALASKSVQFEEVTPGESRTLDTLVVLHNYYSPSSPEGRRSELSEIYVAVDQTLAEFTCFDGPNIKGGRFFKLDGGTFEGSPDETEDSSSC